ncbi:MAG: type II toxin-antitoxin system VapB family antitoxin [Gemmatimonadota bacterium]|nr:type II toxin-antitoxin system VapB family antitoxin [Gemmatimonadota bacterium]
MRRRTRWRPGPPVGCTWMWVPSMYFCMRTTLDLDDDLMRAVKQRAAETQRTITSIVETALRELLRREDEPAAPFRLDWAPVERGRPDRRRPRRSRRSTANYSRRRYTASNDVCQLSPSREISMS